MKNIYRLKGKKIWESLCVSEEEKEKERERESTGRRNKIRMTWETEIELGMRWVSWSRTLSPVSAIQLTQNKQQEILKARRKSGGNERIKVCPWKTLSANTEIFTKDRMLHCCLDTGQGAGRKKFKATQWIWRCHMTGNGVCLELPSSHLGVKKAKYSF